VEKGIISFFKRGEGIKREEEEVCGGKGACYRGEEIPYQTGWQRKKRTQ